MRYQYEVVPLDGEPEKQRTVLNRASNDGWELVNVIGEGSRGGWPTAYLRREVDPESAPRSVQQRRKENGHA